MNEPRTDLVNWFGIVTEDDRLTSLDPEATRAVVDTVGRYVECVGEGALRERFPGRADVDGLLLDHLDVGLVAVAVTRRSRSPRAA